MWYSERPRNTQCQVIEFTTNIISVANFNKYSGQFYNLGYYFWHVMNNAKRRNDIRSISSWVTRIIIIIQLYFSRLTCISKYNTLVNQGSALICMTFSFMKLICAVCTYGTCLYNSEFAITISKRRYKLSTTPNVACLNPPKRRFLPFQGSWYVYTLMHTFNFPY